MQINIKQKTDLLVDYIMKNCLWQFHSRAWDRKRQNENIIGMTTRLLCGEEVDISTPENKCYWVDAAVLADAYLKRFSWVGEMEKSELEQLMQNVYERMDFLTVTGSLNLELKDPHY